MHLNWIVNQTENPFESAVGDNAQYIVHLAEFTESDNEGVFKAIECCIDKAVSMLDSNIVEGSMYLLFEWDVVYSMLTIVVCDESKEMDSKHVVKCSFLGLDTEMNNDDLSEDEWEAKVDEYAQGVKQFIADYLSTCSGFLKYSLIAAFHSESRDKSELV